MTASRGRRRALTVLALVALAATGCARVVEGSATADPVALAQTVQCDATVDNAVDSTISTLIGVESNLLAVAGFDFRAIDAMETACSYDAARAYSGFLVDTTEGYTPSSPIGSIALDVFTREFCGAANPHGLGELTPEAQNVCGLI